jgi:hypothetical protein
LISSSLKRAVIDLSLSAAGNANIVAAVAGKKIAVVGLVFTSDTATQFRLRSSGGTFTDLTGEIRIAANGQVVLPTCSIPYVITETGEALNVLNGSAPAVLFDGVVIYEED